MTIVRIPRTPMTSPAWQAWRTIRLPDGDHRELIASAPRLDALLARLTEIGAIPVTAAP